MSMKTGVLLINLGTPDDPGVAAVRRYLRQFLSDPRVIDIPALARFLLLNLFILPFRPRTSSAAYRQIWTEQGSPLLYHTRALSDGVGSALGERAVVRFAMRYQRPSIRAALDAFRREGIARLVVFPLYPQYASSSTGSSLEEVYRICADYWNVPALNVMPPFFDHEAYLACQTAVIRESLGDPAQFDHVLFSFHGLPERQIRKSALAPCVQDGTACLALPACCERIGDYNAYCYRAQSSFVARELSRRLAIPGGRWSIGFQSRLGRTPWIQPFTDVLLASLAERGVRRLAVAVPSFTADCLETIEEIGIRGVETFKAAGGESLHLVPCLNAHPAWVEAIAAMLAEMGVQA